MDSKRRKKIIIAIIILVLIGVLFLILRLSQGPSNVPGEPIENAPVLKVPSADLEYQPDRPPADTEIEFQIKELAKNFASRFGSWSTDNLGHNLQELLPLSSDKMTAYLQSIELKAAEQFSGITTKSLSADILSQSGNNAEVMVGTQRIETDAQARENVYYQDIKISVVKGTAGWVVDAAKWQDKK
ncbi:MAG: hypothetical protein C3F02_02645 [Parcubacteria group bacterium]|nr:MAG: hypothetical protein C3F02_02645 [Parcubacteria group bacterium]